MALAWIVVNYNMFKGMGKDYIAIMIEGLFFLLGALTNRN